MSEGCIGQEAGLDEGENGGEGEVELYGAGLRYHEDEGEEGQDVHEGDHEAALNLAGAHFAAALEENKVSVLARVGVWTHRVD
jgi:hypothetical protein